MYAKVFKVVHCSIIANKNNLETTECPSTGDWIKSGI